MTKVDLHPLSLGEVLDRTFALYRQNFLLFVALAGIPRLPSIMLAFIQLWFTPTVVATGLTWAAVSFMCVAIVLGVIGYLLAQGGTVLAVSQLYLGRDTTVVESFRRIADDLLTLLGVLVLHLLAIFAATLLFIFPGIYVACRLFPCVPVAVIEKRGPTDTLSRSFQLTQGFAGRAFVIMLFYFAIALGLSALVVLPITLVIVANASDLSAVRFWGSIQTVLSSAATIVLTPIVLIATSIYYYDLRVRKEAFDLQLMMDPDGANVPRADSRSVIPEGQ